MTAPARNLRQDDPLDTIALAIARSLAREHHAAARRQSGAVEGNHARSDLRPL